MKFLTINLVIFITIIGLAYYFTRPSVDKNPLSSTVRERFMADAHATEELYNKFRKAVEAQDLNQRLDSKVNLEQKLNHLKSSYGQIENFNSLSNALVGNYSRLVTLHEASSSSKIVVDRRKKELADEIKNLEADNQKLEMKLMILQSQPAPTS